MGPPAMILLRGAAPTFSTYRVEFTIIVCPRLRDASGQFTQPRTKYLRDSVELVGRERGSWVVVAAGRGAAQCECVT